MKIVQIISEHKSKLKAKPVKPGYKRVMAIVEENDRKFTKHIDIPK